MTLHSGNPKTPVVFLTLASIKVENCPMACIVAITGAGVGRAVVTEFARHGCDMASLSRDPERLEVVAAVGKAAASRVVEEGLGPIDLWVNVAMAMVFAPTAELTAKEFRHGTAAVLKRVTKHGGAAGGQHSAVRLGAEQDRQAGAAGATDPPARAIYFAASARAPATGVEM